VAILDTALVIVWALTVAFTVWAVFNGRSR